MNIISTKWPCPGKSHHSVIEASFDVNDIRNAAAIAEAKVNFINAHNPGGILRSPDVIKNRIIAGKLADSAVLAMIEQCIAYWGLSDLYAVREYDKHRSDNFENPDPYDLEIINFRTQEIKTIEVRSSFCYRLAPVSKIVEKLSVYGWYTSANKPAEPPRDWYFQVIYYLRPSDIENQFGINVGVFEDQLYNGSVTAYVVGGAPRPLLETAGINRTDQDGASYRSIYPVCRAYDCIEMLNAVLGRNGSGV
ncbi:hypothetical protein SBW04_06280 [Pseudomonas aeruginosa]|nr:hypothetical protein [Pseudomonas aeruginosa]MDW5716241.1 hypothetical protein [Pseudomonas aeruginosa]